MAHTEQDAPFEGGRGRCAVLCTSGSGQPEELHRVLGSRNLEITPIGDVFEAMTALVLHERRVAGGECDRVFLLVVVEPDQVPQAKELARAAALFAPHAGLWQYQAEASPQLSALVEREALPTIEIKTPMGRGSMRSHRIARAKERGQHALRLAGTGSVGPARQAELPEMQGEAVTESILEDPAALTSEELSMLLGEEPDVGNANNQK